MKPFESGDVREVLRAPGRTLVLEQVVESDHIAANAVCEIGLHPPRPSIPKVESADRSEDVDSSRLDADLQTDTRRSQVSLSQAHERRAELYEAIDDLWRVLGARFDPHVEILRCSWPPVHTDGIGSDDQKPCISA
ncbi:MAG TPA: hypothetical protein VH142_12300 [Polyangiaceae bacterium]|nr:hypothetical protein [Polyangiaceae bacterium]